MNERQNIPPGPGLLNQCEDNWHTEMGAIFFGERAVLRGKDIFEAYSNHRWLEFMVSAVTGRESKKTARLIEAMWVICSSYPDPRLWNNRIAALGGTTRTTGALAINAGSAVSEATIYGLKTSKGAIDLLHRFKKELDFGASLEELIHNELKQYRVVWGYGRPLASGDERVAPLMKFAKSIDCGTGPFVKLAFEIGDYLSDTRYKYQINISAVVAALMADEGLSTNEFYYLSSLSFVGGMFPCYIDAINHPEGTLFPLSTGRINYIGAPTDKNWLPGDNQ